MASFPSATNLTQSASSEPLTLDPGIEAFLNETRFWIQRVAVPVLMVIGLFGNSITVIIMTRRRMRSTTNMYLAALAFVDMLYLVLTFVLGLSHYPNMASPDYYAYWRLKPFVTMLTDACSNTSVWLTVTFTIERYIAVRYPMKGKVWCTEARAKMLIICVFAMGILFAAPVPLEWEVVRIKIPPEAQATTTNKTISPNTTVAYRRSNVDFHNNNNDPNRNNNNNGHRQGASTELESTFGGSVVDVLGPSDSWNQNGAMDFVRPAAGAVDNYKLALNYTDFGLNKTYKTFYYWSTVVMFYFIPLFSLMLFNGFLIKSVHQSKRERTRMLRPSATSSTECSTKIKSDLSMDNLANGAPNQVDPLSRSSSHDRANTVSFNCSQSLRVQDRERDRDGKRSPVLSLATRHKGPRPSGDSTTLSESSQSSPLLGDHRPNTDSHAAGGDRKKLDKLCSNGTSFRSDLSSQTMVLIEESSITGSSSNNYNSNNNNNETHDRAQSLDSSHELAQDGLYELGVQINCDHGAAAATPVSGQRMTKSNQFPEAREKGKTPNGNNPSSPSLQPLAFSSSPALKLDEDSSANDKTNVKDTITTIGGDGGVTLARKATLHRSHQTNASSKSHHSYAPGSSQERRITIMLIAVVILFLVCQIPSAAMILYSSVHEMDPDSNEGKLATALNNIFNFLMAVNAAGNFILYSFLSKKYRRTFIILFCGCLRRRKESDQKAFYGVRFETSSQSLRHTNSIYQSNRFDDKPQKDTLV